VRSAPSLLLCFRWERAEPHHTSSSLAALFFSSSLYHQTKKKSDSKRDWSGVLKKSEREETEKRNLLCEATRAAPCPAETLLLVCLVRLRLRFAWLCVGGLLYLMDALHIFDALDALRKPDIEFVRDGLLRLR
jgi:hypothetical protein